MTVSIGSPGSPGSAGSAGSARADADVALPDALVLPRLLDEVLLRDLLGESAAADYAARFSLERRNEILGGAYAEAAR